MRTAMALWSCQECNMIATPCYKGQGLGNFLANYCAVRCLALDKKYDFGVQFPENFKGSSFLDLDMGLPVVGGRTSVEGQEPEELPEGFTSYYREANIGNGDYDPGFLLQPDNTLIHGLLQGMGYIEHRKGEVNQWLTVEPIDISDNVCVINFRAGEYRYVPEFFLPKSYWEMGIAHMLEINPQMEFVVHCDDPETARKFFPNYPIVSDIGINWRSIRYAKYLLLSNSSFAILPAFLSDAYVVAPKYFARYSLGYWFLEQNKMSGWNYLDSSGIIGKL